MMSGLESSGPLTGRFPRPGPSAEVLRRYGLSEADCRLFEEQGFLTGLDLLSSDEVSELGSRLDRLGAALREHEPLLYEIEAAWLERPGEVVLHFLGAWRIDELFHDLVFHPAVTVPCAQLLGTDRLRFWHDQVFWKPPGHPGVVPWHQDYAYWTRTEPAAHITMFIALDEMSPENGGLEYVPSTHRWGLLPKQDFGGELDALHAALSPEQRAAFRPEPVRLGAGQASIHHSHLIHGSRANGSNRPRRGIVLNYIADGVRVADDSAPLLAGVPVIPRGQPLAGAFFPVVLELSSPGGGELG